MLRTTHTAASVLSRRVQAIGPGAVPLRWRPNGPTATGRATRNAKNGEMALRSTLMPMPTASSVLNPRPNHHRAANRVQLPAR